MINRSNAYRQSAISITVSVKDGDAIRVAVSAGTYTKVPAMDPATGERLENKYKYPRTALAWKNDNAPLILPTPTDGLKKFPIGTTGLQFDITYRYRTDDSCIYTFTLENAKPKVKENVSDEECFFQCKFKLFSEKGFSPLSDSQRITQDEDYQSNQLLYRNVRNYAIGHGCAADWDDSESVLWITTAIFPKYDIKPIVPSAIKGVSLDMLKMSPYGSFADTIRELRMMCAKYREWINGLRTIRQDLSTEYKITADRHITNCETCLSRMEKGVELLEQNENIRIAFQYTLRLLTAQQYERASAMICACDLIRKSHEDLFGRNRITIGLWVGSSTTPNKVSGAVKAYEKLYRGEGSNPFVMLKCPWCGAQMGPVQKGKNQWELPGYRKVPLGRRRFGFAFRCRNHQCDFSTEDLPLFVVDESIYEETPTLLLGTVDKFAMLPFRPNAQKIFGYENGVKKTSPDLIIQDELHLISGPLGSMVGHYETLIHELCTTRTASGDIHPKIIASTATISRAKEQCHALYGCDQNDVFQFPPSGLDAGKSFFAEEKRNQNGRRYVGILATGSSSDATTAIRLFASLLYGAKAMRVDSEKDRDPYWTNMGYYNSIRELGQAATWIRADIDQHLDVINWIFC